MKYCYSCMKELNTEGKCPYCGFDINTYEIEPHQLKPGTVLRDRFVVGRVIGEGGFGITYVGIDNVLRLKVAIKEFYMSGFVNRNNTISSKVSYETGSKKELFEKNREKFIQEARTLALFVNTEGIVDVRDFFYENNTAYIVMSFVEGDTLKYRLKEKNKLSVDETLAIVKPIMRALKKVHEQNVIHRDISPDNILLSKDGKVCLIDFGAAREYAEDDVKSLSIILKPGYAPLEQYRSKGVQGPWTDIYALSAVMYRCISGKRLPDALERMIDDTTGELYKIQPDCPKELSDIVMKGLAIQNKDRYQNIGDLVFDLEKFEENERTAKYEAERKHSDFAEEGKERSFSGSDRKHEEKKQPDKTTESVEQNHKENKNVKRDSKQQEEELTEVLLGEEEEQYTEVLEQHENGNPIKEQSITERKRINNKRAYYENEYGLSWPDDGNEDLTNVAKSKVRIKRNPKKERQSDVQNEDEKSNQIIGIEVKPVDIQQRASYENEYGLNWPEEEIPDGNGKRK